MSSSASQKTASLAADEAALMNEPSSAGRKSAAAIDLAEFRIGWRILILGIAGVATSVTAALLYGFSAMIVPLGSEFGWGRGELQAAMSFLFGGAVISTQIIGWLNARYGLRAVTAVSLVALAAGYLALTQVGSSIWWLYLGFALLPIIAPGTTAVTWTQLINLWFDRNRGLALALILSGTGIAAALMPNLISWGIERWDWKTGFILLALPAVLLTLPLTLLWMKVPAPSAPKKEASSEPHEPLKLTGFFFHEAVGMRNFWACNIALVLIVSAVVAMVTGTVPMLRDKGLSATEASQIFGAFGVSLILGRVLVGYLIDRIWAPAVAAVALSLPAAGCLLFMTAGTQTELLVAATMLVGIGAGAEFDIAAFLIARYFGMRAYGRLFGLHVGLITTGTALAPLLFGWLFEATKSYTPMLTISTAAFIGGSLLLLTLGRYPKFD